MCCQCAVCRMYRQSLWLYNISVCSYSLPPEICISQCCHCPFRRARSRFREKKCPSSIPIEDELTRDTTSFHLRLAAQTSSGLATVLIEFQPHSCSKCNPVTRLPTRCNRRTCRSLPSLKKGTFSKAARLHLSEAIFRIPSCIPSHQTGILCSIPVYVLFSSLSFAVGKRTEAVRPPSTILSLKLPYDFFSVKPLFCLLRNYPAGKIFSQKLQIHWK